MELLLDAAMAIGPSVGYVHQYRLISQKQQVGSFSIDICGILLFANILRLNFYIFTKYQLALFYQSVIMIIVQIFLIRICTKHANKKHQSSYQPKQQSSQSTQIVEDGKQRFWKWKNFHTYLICIGAFVIITLMLSICFKKLEIQAYGVFLGLVALLSESILILPQIIKNFRKKSTKGLSHLLVTLNLLGDLFKLGYFIIKAQPFQFIMCGIIQVALDGFVIIQIIYYRHYYKTNDKQGKSLVMDKKSRISASSNKKSETQQNLGQVIELKDNEHIVQPEQYENNAIEVSFDQDEQTQQKQLQLVQNQLRVVSDEKQSQNQNNQGQTQQNQQQMQSDRQINRIPFKDQNMNTLKLNRANSQNTDTNKKPLSPSTSAKSSELVETAY